MGLNDRTETKRDDESFFVIATENTHQWKLSDNGSGIFTISCKLNG